MSQWQYAQLFLDRKIFKEKNIFGIATNNQKDLSFAIILKRPDHFVLTLFVCVWSVYVPDEDLRFGMFNLGKILDS